LKKTCKKGFNHLVYAVTNFLTLVALLCR